MMRSPQLLGDLLKRHPLLHGVSLDSAQAGMDTMNTMEYDWSEGLSFPPEVSEAYKEMVWASRQRRIKDISPKRIVADLNDLIRRAIAENPIISRLMGEDAVPTLVRDVAGYLLRDFRLLSMAEVAIAFREGARGTYGELGRLYSRTFYRWLRAYRELRRTTLTRQSRFEVDAQRGAHVLPTPTKDALIQCLLREYREYVATGTFHLKDPSCARFNLLLQMGLLSWNDSKRQALEKRAMEMLTMSVSGAACSAPEEEVTGLAKDLALHDLFKQWLARGKDPRELIRSAR